MTTTIRLPYYTKFISRKTKKDPSLKGLPIQKLSNHRQSRLWLIRQHHVPRIKHLEKGQSARWSGQTLLLLRITEIIPVCPIQIDSPGTISKVVADEDEIPSIDEGGNASFNKVFHIGREVFHPIGVEFQVDEHIACLPLKIMLCHVKSLLGGIKVHESWKMGKVVAEGVEATRFNNVVAQNRVVKAVLQ